MVDCCKCYDWQKPDCTTTRLTKKVEAKEKAIRYYKSRMQYAEALLLDMGITIPIDWAHDLTDFIQRGE